LLLVTKRSFLGSWRDPNYNALRLANVAGMSIMVGLVYLHVQIDSQQGVLSMMASLLLAGAFVGILSFSTALPTYAAERSLFYRERAANYYTPEAYSIAIGIVEIPWIFALALLQVLILYWSIGYRQDVGAFFTLLLGAFQFSLNWVWISQWFAAFFPNVRIANIIGGIHISLTMLFPASSSRKPRCRAAGPASTIASPHPMH